MIRPATLDDAGPLTEIYNHYVKHTVVSFEEDPIPTSAMRDRIAQVTRSFPWFVAEERNSVVGYAYARPWHPRSAYRRTGETTIYLAPGFTRRGTGSRLYGTLLEELRTATSLHAVLAGIALPNPASVALHEKLGFHKAGLFRETGWKFGTWTDVGYWQLHLHPTRECS